jgi:hypothetical protein
VTPPRNRRQTVGPSPPMPADSGDSTNTLIYVEKELILPVAARLVGTSVSTSSSEDFSGGLDWVVAASAGYSSERSAETDVAKLFPEDVFHYAYPRIERTRISVRDYCAAINDRTIRPPDVLSVTGRLEIGGLSEATYDPFDPPRVDLPNQYRVYGYRTFSAALEAEGFTIPIHFLADSAELVFYANYKPVEVVGVVKWSPSYETGGYTLNGILLCAALLLAR